ncbi:MAG: SDR family NAD(P)-dependent oxidoreductase [Gemmatimonadales bacterium]
MRPLDQRVMIVTGAGRGLGRSHALLAARLGAAVVVNDKGGDLLGQGDEPSPADQVVAEIRAAGGEALASHHDVADWQQAEAMIRLAVAHFGDLHVLVNNAGILRDRSFANLNEDEWDAVIRVHLKGHAAPTRHALAYWRERAKRGAVPSASLVHTSSLSGLAGNFGQANYAAAKLGIVALSRVAALEGAKYGVRSNAVSPSGRTRMTLATPGGEAMLARPSAAAFDYWDPANVSPVVCWLARADCPATSQVFHVMGNRLYVMQIPSVAHQLVTEGRWTLDALDQALAGRLTQPLAIESFFEGLGS